MLKLWFQGELWWSQVSVQHLCSPLSPWHSSDAAHPFSLISKLPQIDPLNSTKVVKLNENQWRKKSIYHKIQVAYDICKYWTEDNCGKDRSLVNKKQKYHFEIAGLMKTLAFKRKDRDYEQPRADCELSQNNNRDNQYKRLKLLASTRTFKN